MWSIFSSKPADVLKALEVDPAQGLSAAEAEKRLGRYGANVLAEKKEKTNLQRFFDQFKDAMILIPDRGGGRFLCRRVRRGEPRRIFEPALILLIVILNAVMGVLQESKAEKALDALKGLSAPHARVLRGGRSRSSRRRRSCRVTSSGSSRRRFYAGRRAPAAKRGLKSEESALTGESVPAGEGCAGARVAADAALGDRVNMVFPGAASPMAPRRQSSQRPACRPKWADRRPALRRSGDADAVAAEAAPLGRSPGFVALGACAVIFVVGLLNGINVLEIFCDGRFASRFRRFPRSAGDRHHRAFDRGSAW